MEKKYSKKKLREFGLLFGFFFPVFFGFFLPFIFNHENRFWPLLIGIFFILMGLLKPNKLKVFYDSWLLIGFCLGWVNSRIIFTIIFLVIIMVLLGWVENTNEIKKKNFNYFWWFWK